MNMRSALIFLLLGLSSTLPAQTTEAKFSASELRDDLALLKRALTERHPDLYAFVPKDTVEHRFLQLEASITDSMTIPQAYERMSAVVNNLGCGHTVLTMPTWYFRACRKEYKRLPFKFKYRNGELYITRSYLEDTTLALGWRVLAVDGNKVEDLAARFMRNYSTDGFNQTLKYRQFETGFRNDYSVFIGHPDTLSLDCIDNTGEKRFIKVPTLTSDTINARFTKRYNLQDRPKEKLLEMRIDSGNVAVMSISSFHPGMLWKNRQSFKRYVKKSFKKLDKNNVNDLIIDLRNNPGGYPIYGIYLYSWIADSSFRYFDRMELPTKKPITFLKYTDKNFFFNSMFLLVSRSRETGECHYRWRRGMKTYHPRKRGFKGNVYVLINGNSFSNTSNFSALAHYQKRAEFIGEETGGRYDGCNGCLYVLVTLPNTEMRVNVPLVKNTYPFQTCKGRGVMPDHPVEPEIQDVINGVDTEMKYTFRLIKKKRALSVGK